MLYRSLISIKVIPPPPPPPPPTRPINNKVYDCIECVEGRWHVGLCIQTDDVLALLHLS